MESGVKKEKNLETETDLKIVVDKATKEVVASAEIQEAVDPDAGKIAKIKKFFEKPGVQFTTDVIRVGGLTITKIVWGLLKFGKKMVEKKGKISFKEGFDIGKEMLSFDAKGDKK